MVHYVYFRRDASQKAVVSGSVVLRADFVASGDIRRDALVLSVLGDENRENVGQSEEGRCF